MEMTVNAMEENPNRENIIKVWEDYTIEDAIVVTEKAMKAIGPETIKHCEDCVQVLYVTSQDLQQILSRKSWKRLWIHGKKKRNWAVKVFKIRILEKFKS